MIASVANKDSVNKITSEMVDQLQKAFPKNLHRNQSLKKWTTFHCTALANCMLRPKSFDELQKLIQLFHSYGLCFEKDWHMIGRGSNLLVRDGGYPGVLVDLSEGLSSIKIIKEDQGQVTVRAEGGLPNGTLLQWAREKNLKGFGFTFGIPGSIGGGIRMNAGTPLGCFADIVIFVEGVNSRGDNLSFPVSSKDFTYRQFLREKDLVITAAHFQFQHSTSEIVQKDIEAAKNLRKNQPLDLPNIGSVFKNPKDDYAAQLIEKAGLKGFRIGNAEISRKHSNFIVNLGWAKTKDALRLITKAQQEVQTQFGVTLDPEVHVIGVDE